MTFSTKLNNWRRVVRYAPLILWVGVIFFASSTAGSMNHTSRFIRPFLEWLFPNTSAEMITIYHGYIRKAAHFVEYAILAFFASRAFWSSSKQWLQRNWIIPAFLFPAIVASVDEFNQSFNSQRTGTIYDVLIDCAGAAAMIVFLKSIRR